MAAAADTISLVGVFETFLNEKCSLIQRFDIRSRSETDNLKHPLYIEKYIIIKFSSS